MHGEENKAVVRRFVAAINEQRWDELDRLVAPAFVRHSRSAGDPPVNSREALKDYLRRELRVFPDARESIELLVAEDDKVAALMTFSGTQRGPMGPFPPSGRVLKARYLCIYRLEAGQIAEAWAEWDNLSALIALGHYRQPG